MTGRLRTCSEPTFTIWPAAHNNLSVRHRRARGPTGLTHVTADQARPLLGHAVTFRDWSGRLRTVFMAAFASDK